ncbi:hypothetical protein C0Q70_13884 [Pomacea canaliculata]|uniref:Uncharacterized protein n=1 Tax=Pomacea canaliculata TaxID=400727 RepID=A0A2T7NYI4_POMCA|nr:hypothetical protein C0Q70_13884 [Pomacea canaliculata]
MCEELTTNAELPERTVHFDDKNDDLEIMWLQEKFHGFANIGVTTLPAVLLEREDLVWMYRKNHATKRGKQKRNYKRQKQHQVMESEMTCCIANSQDLANRPKREK